jgi:putative oxidoreductase
VNTRKALGRALLSGMFIRGGYHAAKAPGARVALVEKAGLPKPELLVKLDGTLMVIGGILLALGIKPKHAALLLAACLIPTTYVGHNFWDQETEQARDQQKTQFMKNVAMLGGLVSVLADDRRSAA